MKSTFFKPLTTLFIVILMVSCSVDSKENIEQLDSLVITEESIEQQIFTQNETTQDQSRVMTTCGDPNIYVTDGEFNFYYIYVEYEPGSKRGDRQAIRAPYCDRMVSITPCSGNMNAEIWHVKGFCPVIDSCRPDIIKPTDPNLRLATFADTCQ